MLQLASTIDEDDDETDSSVELMTLPRTPQLHNPGAAPNVGQSTIAVVPATTINLFNQPGNTLPDAHLDY